VNVEERKQQARLFEQQGEFTDALEVYEQILAELEGTPEIWRELPLYVKAGDLSLKMGDPSAAISQYEKAARAYAAYGSSKSVIALCTKILRVNPGHTHAFLRLVRLMIERDHLAGARLVLVEYSERMKLPKAGLVLEGMADRSDAELKPVLELLLELGGRYEYARAQGRDRADDNESDAEEQEHDAGAATEDSAETSDSSTEDEENLVLGEQFESGFSQQDEEVEHDELVVEPEPGESVDSTNYLEPEELEAAPAGTSTPDATVPGEDDVQWVAARESVSVSTPRASRKVLFREGEARKNKPKALWIGLGAAAVLVVGGLSLVLFNVIPLGGGGGPALQAAPAVDPADSALLAGVELDDLTGAEGDSSAAAPGENGGSAIENEAPVGRDSVADEPATVGGIERDSGVVEAVVGDNQQEVVDEPSAEQVAPETPPSRGVMVQDFDIESTTEFTAEGRAGYRITQMLGTGEMLVLSAVYFGDDIASAPGTEQMTLAPLDGDTTTAILHFNGYAVEARAIVSASVLEALLGRLTEVLPSN
jgi:tetratricopeptide (TPR) repeat protein